VPFLVSAAFSAAGGVCMLLLLRCPAAAPAELPMVHEEQTA
jgi:hypothetical protein